MRRRLSRLSVAAALVLVLAAATAAPATGQTSRDSVSGALIEATQDGAYSGLPQRVPVPRTMAAHWPVFALFAASWIGIAGFLLVTGRRTSRLTSRLREREEAR
jgi:CcmD family protein